MLFNIIIQVEYLFRVNFSKCNINMEDSGKTKRNISEVKEDISEKETVKTEEMPSTSATSNSTTEQKQHNSQLDTKPIFHQPPKKKRKRSFSPVNSTSSLCSKVSPPCSGPSSRRENTPPTTDLIRHYHHTDGVGGSPTGGSGSSAAQGPVSLPQPPLVPPPPSMSPRGGVSPQVRRLGSLEGTGVGILRDGAGWPGFGSEEEMGMSSSGAEEDERNNKYTGFEWQWDDNAKSNACCLAKMKTEVRFHLDYSCGTAAARGSENMRDGQFYWEVKMVSPVYGTDMMIGVGTKQVDLNQYSRAFCSMLGHEPGSESCGLSYTGRFQKGGIGRLYCSKFGQGAVIGMHLDMWFGTLTYYKNGKHLGIVTRNLMSKTWYPIVSSTAARSSMRLVNTKSFPSNLQFFCCQALRKAVPPEHNVLDVVPLPPGLKNFLEDNLSWLLRAHESKTECKTKGTQTVLSMMSKRWKEKMESEAEDV